MDGFVCKKRMRSPPPPPKRKATLAQSASLAPRAKLDDVDDDPWLVRPVAEGGATPLTCRTSTDAEVASLTSSVATVQPAASLAAAQPVAKRVATLDALVRKYPPLGVKRLGDQLSSLFELVLLEHRPRIEALERSTRATPRQRRSRRSARRRKTKK